MPANRDKTAPLCTAFVHIRYGRARKSPGLEPQLGDRRVAERGVQLVDELGAHQLELLGPDGRPARHRDHSRRARRRAAPPRSRARRRPPPSSPGRARAWSAGSSPEVTRRERERERPRRPPPAHAASAAPALRDRPVEHRGDTFTSEADAPGTWSTSVVVISAWPPARTRSASRSRRVASSSDITSSRSISGGRPRAPEHVALGEQEREQADALLPLRAERPQRAAAVEQRRGRRGAGPCVVKPRSRSAGAALDQLAAQPVGVGRLRARHVAQLDGVRQPELGRARRERRGDRRDRAGAVGHQLRPVAGELRVPRRRAGPHARRRRARGRPARCAAPARASTRSASRRERATSRRRPGRDASAAMPARPSRARGDRAGTRTRAAAAAAVPPRSSGAPSTFTQLLLVGRREADLERVRPVLARRRRPPRA